MVDNSAIEWTDATCCEFCYAEGFNKRLGTRLAFKPGHRKDIEIFLDEKMLTQPLRWKKPRTIFVCSMTDLFADFAPDEFIDKIFAVMALCPQHTFQVLTKRAARMQGYCCTIQKNGRWLQMEDVALQLGYEPRGQHDHGFDWISNKQFLPNVWLGVSTERQQEADERIPHLLQTPAAVRFISAEPLLGPIDLTVPDIDVGIGRYKIHPDLDWVIVGGESGPKARPMHPDWARSLRDQCQAACVAFFFKQWGEHAPVPVPDPKALTHGGKMSFGKRLYPFHRIDGFALVKFGKKRAGRHLDGELHNAMPVRA